MNLSAVLWTDTKKAYDTNFLEGNFEIFKIQADRICKLRCSSPNIKKY